MLMEAKQVGVAQNAIKWKPNKSLEMFQYSCRVPASRQSPYWWAPHLAAKASRELLVPPHALPALLDRQPPRECDADQHRMTAGTAADRYQRQPVTHPSSSYRSCARKTTSHRAGGCSKPLTCQHLIPASPAAQWLQIPREPFRNPTLSWALEAKSSCLFAIFYCFSMFWKMWTGFLQPGFICTRPIHLTFCKQFCFGEWMKCIYLAAQATWVATAKQRNYLCSQQGDETANYAILDK